MSEFDGLFDNLVPRGTVRFTLSKVHVRCDKPLVFIMRHAGEGNAEYKSMRTKLAKEASAASGVDVEANRAALFRIFAATVIEGWENCIARDGKPLPYAPAIGAEFLHAIHAAAPDEVQAAFAYAANPDNFRGSIAEASATLGK